MPNRKIHDEISHKFSLDSVYSVGHVLFVTRWLILSSATQSAHHHMTVLDDGGSPAHDSAGRIIYYSNITLQAGLSSISNQLAS